MYGFVPSAGAVLTEWGADVIKVEHAITGDPQRGLRQTGLLRVEGDPNPNIEHANRNKRSIGLDMSVPACSGALSYGDGKPGVVKASALLPVDEPMIFRPIDGVVHQNASVAVDGRSFS